MRFLSRSMNSKVRFTIYLVLSLLLMVGFFLALSWVQAQRAGTMPVTRILDRNAWRVVYFHRIGCPHCALANPEMAELQLRYPQVNWLVIEVSLPVDPAIESFYRGWLNNLNERDAITPLTVVGDLSQDASIIPGFGDPVKSREPIENEIRKRLQLPPVDLEREAIRFPLIGMRVLSDMPTATAGRLLALLAGLPIATFMAFFGFLWAPIRRTPRFAALFSLGLLLGHLFMQTGLFFWGAPEINPFMQVFLRLSLGWGFVFWAIQLFQNFFKKPGRELDTLPVPYETTELRSGLLVWLWLMGLLWLEKCSTSWIPEFSARILGQNRVFWPWVGISLAPTCLCGFIGCLYLWLGEFSPRAKRVASLFCFLIMMVFGCLLLFGMQFTGYGPFWSLWFRT